MIPVRPLLMCAWIVLGAGAGQAQEVTAAVPSADQGSYNPQLSAKEAVLVNWTLATSGLRAGKYVSDTVVAATDLPFAKRATQAQFASETMLLRYAASYWLFTMDETLTPIDARVLLAASQAARVDCTGACAAETEALTRTFRAASTALGQAAEAAEQAAAQRAGVADTVALAELLSDMASYLDSDAWHTDLSLTDLDKDGEEIAARVVGTLAVWRNVEPFVGLRNAEIDAAVNAATQDLLRAVRRGTRGKATLAPDSAEIARMRQAATATATALRRASRLFDAG